ncbi:MAG: hypothetical protein ABI809_13120 [Caldimonas sp.]
MADRPKEPNAPPEPPAHKPGQTTPQRHDAEPAPKLPHERDESSASQQGAPRDVMRQAGADIERGLVDTSRGEVADGIYAREFRSEPQGAPERSKPPGDDSKKRR